jgi:PPOX class probable FMN-dependent enzyme
MCLNTRNHIHDVVMRLVLLVQYLILASLSVRTVSLRTPQLFRPPRRSIMAASVGLADIGANSKTTSLGSIEPWSDRILQSIKKSRKVRGGNYVQIATVDAEGHPRCRTVVFRGFQGVAERGGREALRMITDARSEKVVHATSVSSCCELVWWFSQSSEQFRIAGDLELVGADSPSPELLGHRKQQWGNLSDFAREQFYWTAPPGHIHDEISASAPPAGGRGEDGAVLPPPETFLIALLWPKSVKYLRLSDNYSQKDDFDESSKLWTATRVNP